MQQLEVGQRLYGKTSLPESVRFDFSDSGGFLEIAFKNPSYDELSQIKRGKKLFGLVEKNGIIFFLFKSGNLNWMDAPYEIKLSKPYTLEYPKDENIGYAITFVFADSRTAIIKSLKLLSMPHDMSVDFYNMVQKQKEVVRDTYSKDLQEVYSEYSTDDLVKEARIYPLEKIE